MKHVIKSIAVLALIAAPAIAQDGMNVGGSLLATQDTPTQFGNSTGTQSSNGGSELNQLFGDISGGTLTLGITGNLEANFNKMWIFFDAVPGGENVLAGDNNDGGFNEINNMAGLTFDAGFEPDHGIRLEIGGGFLGIRGFDLIDNTGGDIWTTGGGPADLPLATGLGGFGTTSGWDNSNSLGVTDSDASGAATATTGLEFSIDMTAFFGATPGSVGVSVFISNGDGGFLSNQVLPGIGGLGNLAGGAGVNFNNIPGNQFAVIVPEPATMALLGLGGLLVIRRRR
jgi:hypothetical protein